MRNLKISVIIPTYKRRERLKLTILSLCLQDMPNEDYEIIVVDDAREADLSEVLATEFNKQACITVIKGHGRGAASAKNLAIPDAAGEILVFLDDDVICPRYFLNSHYQLHTDVNTESVVTAMRNHLYLDMSDQNESWLRDCIIGDFGSIIERSYPDYHCNLLRKVYVGRYPKYDATWVCLNGCNFSAKKSLILKSQMFDVRLRYLEDTDMGLRLKNAGGCFFYCEEATNYHIEHAFDIASRKAGWESNFPIFRESHKLIADIYRLFFFGKISFEAFNEACVTCILPVDTNGHFGSYWFWESLAMKRWNQSHV